MATLEERFWSHVQRGESCWDWTGYLDHKGYGRFNVAGTIVRAHCFAYELAAGPIPDGLEIDHLCGNKGCVNSAHLEAVTHRENMLRHWATRRPTHCPAGHVYDAANTRLNKGSRQCRACDATRARARRLKEGNPCP